MGAAAAAQTALAQMASRHRAMAAEQEATFDAALRSAFARMAKEWPSLDARVTRVTQRAISVAEVADLIEPGMLVVLLDGATDDLGVVLICPTLLAALVDGVTTGRVLAGPAPHRPPTRTDASLVAPMIDVLLRQISDRCGTHPLGQGMNEFVYGSFMQDPRPLTLLLEDGRFRLITFSVTLGHVAGTWSLILPAPDEQAAKTADAGTVAETRAWGQQLNAAISGSPAQLDVVLFRAKLSLTSAMQLSPGDMLCIPVNALETLSLRTLNGAEIGVGRLGQARGQRAVRLTRDLGSKTEPDAPAIPRAASMTPVIRAVTATVSPDDAAVP